VDKCPKPLLSLSASTFTHLLGFSALAKGARKNILKSLFYLILLRDLAQNVPKADFVKRQSHCAKGRFCETLVALCLRQIL
jgi:hypothetical protein